MWLTALLFGSVVELVADQLKAQSSDALNAEPVQELVLHQGQQIDFRHQFWRIDAASVCHASRDMHACRPAATALFVQSCQTLSAKGNDSQQQANLRAMYCAAAKVEQGAKATSSVSTPPALQTAANGHEPTALEDLYRECKRTTVLAWISKDELRAKDRDAACGRYELAKAGSAAKAQ